MSIIRKLEPVGLDKFCCDFNDVCEGEVSHKVTGYDGSEKYYCPEHIEEVRKEING